MQAEGAVDVAVAVGEGFCGGLLAGEAGLVGVEAGGQDGVGAGVVQVGPAHGAQRFVGGDGEVLLDADAAEDVAAGGDSVALADALGGLGADVDLADGAGGVDGRTWQICVLVVTHGGGLGLDRGLGHPQGLWHRGGRAAKVR